jgi:PAS domain S-box-containing protein
MPHANSLPDAYKSALVRLGRLALEHVDLSELFRQTTTIVAETVTADFCKILELLPDGERLLVRAGVGWREELVGRALTSSETDLGDTLLAGAPVVLEDLRRDARFPGPSILHDHGVTSGVSLVIPGAEPFGVLAVHTRERRIFSAKELDFLGTVVEMLGLAIHRHRTHEAVSKSEESFRRTFADSPIGLVIGGFDRRFLQANRAICDLLGYSGEELTQLTFEQVTDPEDRERTRELGGKLLCGLIPQFQMDTRGLAKNGRSVWLRLTATLIRDDHGDPLHTVGIIEDLTEQHERQRDLRLARFTLDHAQEAIAWNGPDGRIFDVNESICHLLGYSRQELLSMRVPDVDPIVAAEGWPEAWRNLRTQGPISRESRFRRKDGAEVQVELHVNYLEQDSDQYACMVARDVTERKRVAADLEAREARYRALFENAGAMVSTMDLQGTLTAVNKALEQFSGYTREELVGRNIALLLPPDQHERVREMRERKLREGGTTTYDLEFLTKDGLRRPVQMASNLTEEDGKPVEIQAVVVDVSEQRRAHDLVRRSEQRFRALVENALDMVTVLGIDGTVRYVSPSIEKTLGFMPDERLGKNSFDIIHPDDASLVREAIARGLETPDASVRVEFRIRHKDGSWHCLEANARNLLDVPPVSGIVVNSRDITERKRAEEWFRSSFYDAAIGTAIASLDGRWLQVNPALCHLLGYSEEELLKRRWQEVTHPDDVSAGEDEFKRLLAGIVPWARFEQRYVHKSGSLVRAYIGASLTRDADGQPRAVTAQVVDITQRREAEEALRHTQTELRALAGRLISNEEQEHRSLARDLHDDFSQRLAAVGFDLAAFEKACPPNVPARLKKTLRAAQTSLVGLSDDLRRLAHQLHPSSLELLGLPVALRELTLDASKRGRFSVRLSVRQLPKAFPRSVALCVYRVVEECLRNVAKHAKGDKVSVTLSGVQEGLRVSIRNNGIGFDTATALSRGGLGLISVRERVRLVGGALTIKSRQGRGTEVAVELPLGGRPSGRRVTNRRQVRAESRT